MANIIHQYEDLKCSVGIVEVVVVYDAEAAVVAAAVVSAARNDGEASSDETTQCMYIGGASVFDPPIAPSDPPVPFPLSRNACSTVSASFKTRPA